MRNDKRYYKKEYTGAISISKYFDKYKKKLQAPQRIVVKHSVEIVEECTGILLSESDFEYNVQSKVMVCKVASVYKSELKIQEKNIKQLLKQRLGEKNIPLSFI